MTIEPADINLLWVHLMTLSKTQTVVLCALIAAVPLVWQSQTLSALERERAVIAADVEAAQRNALDLEAEVRRTREDLLRAQADTFNPGTKPSANGAGHPSMKADLNQPGVWLRRLARGLGLPKGVWIAVIVFTAVAVGWSSQRKLDRAQEILAETSARCGVQPVR
jgi:hypothetical protein